MKIFCLFVLMLSGLTSSLNAQQKDIERLMDAYDMLYYNRTYDTSETNNFSETAFYNFFPHPERVQLLRQVDSVLEGIHDIKHTQNKFPFTYARLRFEYYVLKLLNGLDSAKINDYPILKTFADSLDEYYPVKAKKDEIYCLRKKIGIRYLSLMVKNKKFYQFLTNPYNGLLSNLIELKIKYNNENQGLLIADELAMLDLHDYLFSIRNHYPQATQTDLLNRYNKAEKMFLKIKDAALVKGLYPQLFDAVNFEIRWLALQLINNSRDSLTILQKIHFLDTTILFFPDYSEKEIQSLKKISGVGRFTIAYKNEDTNYMPILIQYNRLVLDLMKNKIENNASLEDADFNSIDSLYAISKKSFSVIADSASKAIFRNEVIEIDQLLNYSKGQLFLSKKIYDSAWHYLVISEIIHDLKDQMTSDVEKNISAYKRHVASLIPINWALYDTAKSDFKMEVMDYSFKFNYSSLFSSGLNEVVVVGYGTERFLDRPPKASCRADRLQFKRPVKTLFEANEILSTALKQSGYPQLDYYEIEGGFAIVAPFEQLETDGSPKPDPPRFLEKISVLDNFSFLNYFNALIHGLQGYYRVFIFLVTDDVVSSISSQAGLNLHSFEGGLNALPKDILPTDPYTANHSCTVLVYEFEKLHKNDPARFIVSSKLKAKQHLSSISLLDIFK